MQSKSGGPILLYSVPSLRSVAMIKFNFDKISNGAKLVMALHSSGFECQYSVWLLAI